MNSFTSSLARSASRARTLSQGSMTQPQAGRRSLHASTPRQAIMMPYLSPLMTEGTISSWKKREGESFFKGDILLSIESDFHTVDIEAVNNGILGKILMPDGAQGVKVEEVIALVARDALELAKMRGAATEAQQPAAPSVKVTAPPAPPPLQSISPARTSAELIAPRPQHISHSRLNTLEQPTSPMFPAVHRTHSPATVAHHIMHDAHRLLADGVHVHAGVHTSAVQRSDDDGVAIRRMMRDKFTSHSKKPSTGGGSASPSAKKCATTAYFDGLI